jgi:hypothetical protein
MKLSFGADNAIGRDICGIETGDEGGDTFVAEPQRSVRNVIE